MSNFSLNTDGDMNLSELYGSTRKEEPPWYRRLGGGLMSRLGISILASLIVGTMMNLPYIKMAVLWTCSIILAIFGNPDGPAPVKEKLAVLLDQGQAVAKEAVPSPGLEASRAGPLDRVREVAEKAEEKAKEKVVKSAVAPIREAAEEKVEEVKEQVAETGRAVKEGAEEIASRINPIGSLGFGGPGPFVAREPAAPMTPEQLKELEAERSRQAVLERRRARESRAIQNRATINAAMGQQISIATKQGQAHQQAQQQAVQRFMSGGRP
jgi:hypothetical protein